RSAWRSPPRLITSRRGKGRHTAGIGDEIDRSASENLAQVALNRVGATRAPAISTMIVGMRRSSRNPILTRADIPSVSALVDDVTSVFNPGAIKIDDRYVL